MRGEMLAMVMVMIMCSDETAEEVGEGYQLKSFT